MRLLRLAAVIAFVALSGCASLVPDTGRLPAPDANDGGDLAHEAGDGGPDTSKEGGSTPPPDATDGPDMLTSVDADAAEACSPDCAEEGAFRCSTTGVQICARASGCLVWRDLGACPAEHVCCGGVCVSADDSNCYACGARCEGDTPVCDHTSRRCGCDGTRCPGAEVCDTDLKRCVSEVAPRGYDLYVSAGAQPGGDGSFDHPFRTITEALALSSPKDGGAADAAAEGGPPSDAGDGGSSDVSLESTARRGPRAASLDASGTGDVDAEGGAAVFATRIHVEPGTYDENLGEKFPLMIPGGVALDGAGPERTSIEGMAFSDQLKTGAPIWLTMSVGDPRATTRVSGFALRPGQGAPGSGFFGIQCGAGNAAAWDAVPVAPNTILSNLVIGPYYYRAIDVATSDGSGCNLRVTDTTFVDDENGVRISGCSQLPQYTPVAMELEGNTFRHIHNHDLYGTAVLGFQCVSRIVARKNSFLQSDIGLSLSAVWAPEVGYGTFTIQDNVFDSIFRTGLGLDSSGVLVDELSGNSFTNVTSTHDMPTNPGSVALSISGSGGLAVIKRARNNRFVGNDIGVKFEAYDYPAGFPGSDFGTSKDDPGNNVFRCNGPPPGVSGVFGDVMFALYALTQQASFPFEGNEWDSESPHPVDFTNPSSSLLADILIKQFVSVDATNALKPTDLICPRGIQK